MLIHRVSQAARDGPPPPPSRKPRRSLPARLACVALCAMLGVVCTFAAFGAPAAPPAIVVMTVNDAIGPPSADFIIRTLARAAQRRAPLAIIQLDTPGGLDTSMREIIKAILASPVPVATFVAPAGARAASAGTYIVYASHFAAMAPGTNIGAASPIQIGAGGAASPEPVSGPQKNDTESTETRKVMHDAAAYIRGLAQLRGRNAAWGEQAVFQAVSLSASEALDQHVIDLIAQNPADLARQLDGRTTTTPLGTVRLSTAHAPLVYVRPDWRSRFLAIIANPNVALILLSLGVYGLFFEFANPGFVLPGVVGTICLLVGLFAMQLLPVNYAGLALVLLGLACLVAEAFLPTFGVLGFGGIVAFAIGALMLIDTDAPGYGVPIPLIAGLALGGAAFVATVSSVALRARRRPIVTGAEALVGSVAEVIGEAFQPAQPAVAASAPPYTGWVRVHGERWQASCAVPLAVGSHVRVMGRRGLTLRVEPLSALPASARGE